MVHFHEDFTVISANQGFIVCLSYSIVGILSGAIW
jgi:hypothetical protein